MCDISLNKTLSLHKCEKDLDKLNSDEIWNIYNDLLVDSNINDDNMNDDDNTNNDDNVNDNNVKCVDDKCVDNKCVDNNCNSTEFILDDGYYIYHSNARGASKRK